jgi:predicted phosphatase
MFTLESDLVVGVDVDDTLVSWSTKDSDKPPHPECVPIGIVFDGKIEQYWVFLPNLKSLKTHKHKGHAIVVWSGSGFAWAKKVVEVLALEDYVDLIMAKPKWLLDDMRPEDYMPRPYWGAGDPGKAKI